MAKKQTRRTISVCRPAYEAMLAESKVRGTSASRLTEDALTAFGVKFERVHRDRHVDVALVRRLHNIGASPDSMAIVAQCSVDDIYDVLGPKLARILRAG